MPLEDGGGASSPGRRGSVGPSSASSHSSPGLRLVNGGAEAKQVKASREASFKGGYSLIITAT